MTTTRAREGRSAMEGQRYERADGDDQRRSCGPGHPSACRLATLPVMTCPLSISTPSGARKGALVVVQEAFGVNEHIEDVCARLADAGWLAVAPHLFHRSGDPR